MCLFRSLDIWLNEPDIEQVVAEAWAKPMKGKRPDCIVRDKFKNVKCSLKKWSKDRFGEVDKQIEEYKDEAMRWEYDAELRDLSDGELKTWLDARRIWIEKDNEKASVLKQKARIKWDVERDENSNFFHLIVKRKNNKNSIRGLLVNGLWCEEPTEIKEEVLRYYKNIFSETRFHKPMFASDRMNKLSDIKALNLEAQFTKKEIWEAGDIITVIQWFWENEEISKGCNSSFITLIPKVTDPIGLGDFRPISLIGCYYKIIAKLLVERLKIVVGKLVGEVQNAFIKGRYILDGVLIANETVNYMKQKKRKCLIFKVDFEKAYDSLNWKYLMEVMKCMGFGNKWCRWIDVCLKSASISVLVNGAPTKEFNMGRGVRQGWEDDIMVSHLQYADDTIFFGEWSRRNAINLMCIMKGFEKAAGLKVNLNKSKVYGVGVLRSEVEDMARCMACSVGELPLTY
ncbi:putative RNA-directed DNA polymerase [Tanacetum coccineum]